VPKKFQILVCKGPECGDVRHSADVYAAFALEIARCPLGGNEVVLDRYSCFGKCKRGVNVLVREVKPGENTRLLLMMPTAGPNAYLYHAVVPVEARRILEEHVAGGRPIVEFTRRAPPMM
jgi:(2Fe-2S) ferredoxin